MKRKTLNQQSINPTREANKRARQNKPVAFQETDSIRKQAETYRITTARIPIDALTCTWTTGDNRQVDRSHVQRLCESFMRGELARQSKENYILIQCSARAVKKALENAAIHEAEEDYNGSLRLPVFNNWNEVNSEKPEVLAGQHRIEALREYVKQTDSDAGDLWWICEFYDKGRPKHIYNTL
ncbi:hypothetical protein V8C42DRAFT_158414 [Trichoderma barbatum]